MERRSRGDILRNFGQTLRTVRQRAGMSQEELAARAGLDRTYVGGAERGERNVSLVNLVRLANALGVSLSELVGQIEE